MTHNDDKEQRAEAALVAALLYERGAEKPRGLEVPRGVDTTALAGALTDLPDNVIGKIIRYLVDTVTGTTPWVAHVEGDADRRTVSISRNGRPVGSAVIDELRHDDDLQPLISRIEDSSVGLRKLLTLGGSTRSLFPANVRVDQPILGRAEASAPPLRVQPGSTTVRVISRPNTAGNCFARIKLGHLLPI